jgi:hypothetical protein
MPHEFVTPPTLAGEAPRPLGHPARKRRLSATEAREPSELRVQLPIKFELVINLKMAKALATHGAARFASADDSTRGPIVVK